MSNFSAEVGIIWADDADLVGIYQSVEILRPEIPHVPGLQAAIEDFEKWYEGLNWFDVHVMINDTIAEAARRRDIINNLRQKVFKQNEFEQQKLKERLEPGKTSFDTAILPGETPPLIPEKYKMGAAIAGGALTVLIVLKKLHIL